MDRLDLADLIPVYKRYADAPVISISMAQRKPLPRVNWVGNIQSWIAGGSAFLLSRWRKVSGISWTHLAGKALGSRH